MPGVIVQNGCWQPVDGSVGDSLFRSVCVCVCRDANVKCLVRLRLGLHALVIARILFILRVCWSLLASPLPLNNGWLSRFLLPSLKMRHAFAGRLPGPIQPYFYNSSRNIFCLICLFSVVC